MISIILSLFVQSTVVTTDQSPILKKLYEDFAEEVTEARKLIQGSTPYRMAFGQPQFASDRERIGRVLVALELQQQRIEMKIKRNESSSKEELRDSLLGRWTMNVLTRFPLSMYSGGSALKILNVRGVKLGFTGFPFFEKTRASFSNDIFMKRTERLYSALQEQVLKIYNGSEGSGDSLFVLALKASDYNSQDAIELLGILLSIDTTILDHFDHMTVENTSLIRMVGEIPLLVRLLSELSRHRNRSSMDFFSYDGRHSTSCSKNYYFWSAAFIARQMRLAGIPEKQIPRLSLKIPRLYKFLRFVTDYSLWRKYAGSTDEMIRLTNEAYEKDSRTILHRWAAGVLLERRVTRASQACALALAEAGKPD